MRLLREAPWRRAPLLLWHRPAVALALMAAAAVFTLPIAAGPLFLASAESATLHRQIAAACESSVGARITARTTYAEIDEHVPLPFGPGLVDTRVRWLSSAAPSQPRISAARSTLVAGTYGSQTPIRVLPRAARGRPNVAGVVLVSRDDAPAHVTVLDGPQGRGLWLPDEFARLQGLGVGDRARVLGPEGRVALPVAAIYRDLRNEPDRDFWCGLVAQYRGNPLQEQPVFPFVLVDRETFDAVGAPLQLQAMQTLELPVDDAGMSVPEAERAGQFLSRLRSKVVRQRTLAPGFPYFTSYLTLLPRQVDRAQLARSALTLTVRPMAVAGALTGLLLVAASASYWIDRRRREIEVLAAHGVGPAAIGAKAVLESSAALLPGAALGWLGARALIATIGPSPILAPGVPLAVVLTLCAALVALVAVAVVTTARTRESDVPHHRRGRLGRLPWELAALGGAALAWRLIDATTSTATTDVGSVAHVDPRLLIVPMLLVAAGAGLVARLVRWRLAAAGRDRGSSAPAVFLAGRRIAAAPGAAALLIAVTAVPVALSTYGATVTGSTQRTLRAEARTIVGSDVVFQLTETVEVPTQLAEDATIVLRYNAANLGTKQVDVLGVDPAGWADVAESGVAPLDSLAAELFAGQPTVAVASGTEPGTAELVLSKGFLSGEQRVPVRIAATTDALPAEHGGYSVVVMHRDVLAELTSSARPELWMEGDEETAIRAVVDAQLPVARYVQASTVHADGVYEPVTYTFQFLTALAVLTGAIAALGLVLHLEARSRVRRSAYVMLLRMGLRPRTHLRALLAELSLLLGSGVVVGLSLATLSVWLTRDRYDLAGTVPPATLLVIPWATLVGVVAAVAVVAVLAAAAAQSSVSRAHPAEVLRDTR